MTRKRSAPAFVHDRSGGTALEFALLAVPLVMLILGVFEFGRAFYVNNSLVRSIDYAARLVYLDSSVNTTLLAAELESGLPLIDFDRLSFSDTVISAPAGGGDLRRLDLSYQFDFVVVPFFPDGMTFTYVREVPLER